MKKRNSWLAAGFTFGMCTSILAGGESATLKGHYLGQSPPGKTPTMFAPGVISAELDELNAVFSPDGKELYYDLFNAASLTQAGNARERPNRKRLVFDNLTRENSPPPKELQLVSWAAKLLT